MKPVRAQLRQHGGIQTGPRSSSTTLDGVWLLLARAVWIVLALVSIVLFIAAMPRYHAQALTLTNQDGFIPRNPEQWRTGLHQLGLSPSFYAGFVVVGRSMIALALAGTGIVIFLRRSTDRFGLFVSLALITFGCTSPPVNQEFHHSAVAAAAVSLGLLGEILLFLLPGLFPDGHFVPRWTRWAAIVWAASRLVPVFSHGLVANLAQLVGAVSLAGLVISPIYRYRRAADAPQRQQMKWAIFGLTLALTTTGIALVLHPLFPSLTQSDVSRVVFDLATLMAVVTVFSLFPLFLGIAILRYRLWDIDVLVNRTLVYGSLTILSAVIYIGTVLALEALFRTLTGQGSNVAIAITTLAVAALFTPLRRWIQGEIDRRFYRRKYDATQTLAAFQAKLHNEVDLDQLNADLVAMVRETLQPTHVSLWLR